MDHLQRKSIKKKSLRVVKKHYGLLLILSMIAILLGSEFNEGVLFLHVANVDPRLANRPRIESVERYRDPGADVFEDLATGKVVEGIQLSDELQQEYADSGSGVLGHTEGVIASLVGTVTSGHLYVKILQAIFTITKSPRASIIIFVFLAALIYSLFFGLVVKPYKAIVRRVFLEARTYEKIPFYHVLHLKHSQRWIRTSLCIVYTDFIYMLWFFTIAGAFIKRYSYYMVPYIIAENPDIRPRQAVELSRRMMDGHKMECFKFELTFLGWLLLGFLTGGFLNAFFYAPYKFAAMSEYYALVRADAKAKELPGTELLDDTFLMDPADEETLQKAYRDLAEEEQALKEYQIQLTGLRRFFAENLAIWTGGLTSKEEYQRVENRKFQLADDLDAAAGLSYPERLDPRFRERPLVKRIHSDFLRCYTLVNLLAMFFTFAFIGWVWEVVLFIIQTGHFVNRGSLYGPWVPIYGAGGTLILIVLCKLRERPVIVFFGIALVSGIMEYLTSYIQEMLTGMRYWDYSGYFLNLDGRVCAEGLFAFAALGSMVIYFLAPYMDTLLMKVNNRFLMSVTISLTILFAADVVYSHIHPHTGTGITDMGSVDSLPLQLQSQRYCEKSKYPLHIIHYDV